MKPVVMEQFLRVRGMFVSFQIPRILQSRCNDQSELMLDVASVDELLAALKRQHPGLYGCICNETGMLRPHVNVFVNNDFLRDRDGLATQLKAGDVVSVYQSVSGG